MIRAMDRSEFGKALEMGHSVGWFNMCLHDWLVPHALDKDCVFGTDMPEQNLVGIYSAYRYYNCAWISAVVIDPKYRKKGLANAMDKHAIAYLHNECGISAIGVYCPDEELPRRQTMLGAVLDPIPRIAVCNMCDDFAAADRATPQDIHVSGVRIDEFGKHPDNISELARIDNEVFGLSRRNLFKMYPLCSSFIARDEKTNEVLGVIAARLSGVGTRFGPFYVQDPSIARALLISAMKSTPQERRAKSELWVGEWNPASQQLAESLGWKPEFHCVRLWQLAHGAVPPVPNPTRDWAIAGPDIG